MLNSQTGGASWADAAGYKRKNARIRENKKTIRFMGPPVLKIAVLQLRQPAASHNITGSVLTARLANQENYQ
jgi:hypothetical protein